ncbi:MAG: hypothetical protein FJ104_14245, partial [Deltaproteobacteria bacterium]|nr:hypothetical protein [Deltaproteobacteria bacterium]
MSGPGNPAVAASRHALNLSWLLRLRAWGVAGQLLVVLVVELALGISLPRGPLAALLLVSVASIGAAALYLRRGRPVGEGTVAATLAFDVVLFTALLYFTGGPMNPFSFLYLVHLALATLVVSQRYTWMLVALALAGSAALFVSHVPIAMHGPAPAGSGDPADHADHSAHAGHVDHSAHAGHVDHSAHAAHAGHAGHGGADG